MRGEAKRRVLKLHKSNNTSINWFCFYREYAKKKGYKYRSIFYSGANLYGIGKLVMYHVFTKCSYPIVCLPKEPTEISHLIYLSYTIQSLNLMCDKFCTYQPSWISACMVLFSGVVGGGPPGFCAQLQSKSRNQV